MAEHNNESKMKSLGWELAQKIFQSLEEGGMASTDLFDCFGTNVVGKVMRMDYADAAEKYRAWKTQKEAFHVGDEVKQRWATALYVVTCADRGDGSVIVMDSCGQSLITDNRYIQKTGRTYPWIVRVLNGLKEGGYASSASCSAKDVIGEIERG